MLSSLVVAVLIGIGSYFIFVRAFEKEWFGSEKTKLNDIDMIKSGRKATGSEYTDSGYHEKINKKKVNSTFIDKFLVKAKKSMRVTIKAPEEVKSVANRANTNTKPGCFQQANTIPQAPILAARLLSHVERNDSFASSRGTRSAVDLQRLRMTSNKSEGDFHGRNFNRVNSNGLNF